MNETVFKDRVMKAVNKHPGAYLFKYHGSQYKSGIPDLIGSISGIPYAIEAKCIDIPARGETTMSFLKDLTPKQKAEMDKLDQAGSSVWLMVLCRPLNQIVYINYKVIKVNPWFHMSQAEFLAIDWSIQPVPHDSFPVQFNKTKKLHIAK